MCRAEMRKEDVYAKAVETSSGTDEFVSNEILSHLFCRGIIIENMRETLIAQVDMMFHTTNVPHDFEIKSIICDNICFIYNKMDVIICFM